MKELYDDFSQSSFNVKIINEFINNTHDITGVTFQSNQAITLNSTDEEWKYIHVFLHIFYKFQSISGWLELPKELDWSTKSVGSFFMKNLRNFKKMCDGYRNKNQLKALHQLFSLPQQNLSLPHMASLYTANDFRVFSKHHSANTFDQFEHNNFSILLKVCLENVVSAAFDHETEHTLLEPVGGSKKMN